MSLKDLGQFLDGSLGLFWPCNEIPELDTDTAMRGYVRRDGRSVELKLLNEKPSRDAHELEKYRGVIAATDNGGAIAFDSSQTSYAYSFGGAQRSTLTVRSQALAHGVDIARLRDFRVLEVSAEFLGLRRFSGESASEQSHELDENGLYRSLTIKLASPPMDPIGVPLWENLSITIDATWRTSGDPDNLTVQAPTCIAVRSRHPRPYLHLLTPLLSVQDLLSMVSRAFVPAHSARVRLNSENLLASPIRSSADLWDGMLFTAASGANRLEGQSPALVSLGHLGGLPGLAEWCRLARDHPRPFNAIRSLYRLGPVTAPVMLREVAAAMESWGRSFTAETRLRPAEALANEVGQPFAQWVGDPNRWQKAFWSANNDLKHNRSKSREPGDLDLLAPSGRHLLIAAMLNRAAGSDAPSRAYFDSGQLQNLGYDLRQRYGS